MKKLAAIITCLWLISCGFAANNAEITANYLQSIQNNPLQLQQFFYTMPKGGDIHNHIDGAIYAEDLIKFGAKENFCINPKTLVAYQDPKCPSQYQFANLANNPSLYQKVIDTWSMAFFPINTKPGLPHFFHAFLEFEPVVAANTAKVIASIANRAGRQNEEYLELMIGGLELSVTDAQGKSPQQIGAMIPKQTNLDSWRKKLLTAGLSEVIKRTDVKMLSLHTQVQQLMHCGTAKASPGCKVTIRYQYFALRDLPLPQFYAQLVTAFAVANSSPLVVGINIVMPENWNRALKDYTEQMKMIRFLRTVYPNVHVTLHAGELAFGQVPPKYLTYHVDQAINIAGAERIGHGTDIAYEKHSQRLLNQMAKKHIDVEISLTSNKDVLGVSGNESPLTLYLKNHVPVTLSTDDEGIERTDLTHQYVSAEMQYSLSYQTLKNIARNNLTYGFIEGKPLWTDFNYQHVVPACAQNILGSKTPSVACTAYLKANKKAQLQWHLEHEFTVFEAKIAKQYH